MNIKNKETYKVTISNGGWNKIEIVEKDGKWVRDKESAKNMVESMVNSSWKVVKIEINQ